ncbi:MAG: histidine phosphatase family protein [Inquilinaceae bacterium]
MFQVDNGPQGLVAVVRAVGAAAQPGRHGPTALTRLALARMGMYRFLVVAIATVWLFMPVDLAAGQTPPVRGEAALALLAQPGHHAVMRHGLAPGTGDPVNFTIGDCRTQRNLNDTGRQQARALGDTYRALGIPVTRVLSSQWCRAVETAELLDLGEVTTVEMLNSTWRRDRSLARQRAETVAAYLGDLPPDQTAVLVTHASNIQTLTGQSLRSGATLIVRVADGRLDSVGHYEP